MNVFLCYAGEDKVQAEKVRIALARHFKIFFDETSLPAGQSYHDRIRAGIRHCEVFVFLASANSLTPGTYALTELNLAQRRWPHPAGHVLPVILDGTSLDQLPAYLRAVTVLRTKGNFEAEIEYAVLGIARGIRRRLFRRVILVVFGLALLVATGQFLIGNLETGKGFGAGDAHAAAHQKARDISKLDPDRALFGGFTVTVFPDPRALSGYFSGLKVFSEANVDVFVATDQKRIERVIRVDQRIGPHFASSGLKISDKSRVIVEFDGDSVYEPYSVDRTLLTLAQDMKEGQACVLYLAFGGGELRLKPRQEKNLKAVPALIKVLQKDSSAHFRSRAAEYLGALGDRQATPPLVSALVTEVDAFVKARIAFSLGVLGDASAIPALEKAYAAYDQKESYGYMFELALKQLRK